MNDPDEKDCPACDEAFVVIDGSDWESYANHLRRHLYEDYVLRASVPNEPRSDL